MLAEVVQDLPEVSHVVANEAELSHGDLLALCERVKRSTRLLCVLARIRETSSMNMRLVLAATEILNRVDGCNDLLELGDLLPLLGTGFLLTVLKSVLIGLHLFKDLSQLRDIVTQVHDLVLHIALVLLDLSALLLIHIVVVLLIV